MEKKIYREKNTKYVHSNQSSVRIRVGHSSCYVYRLIGGLYAYSIFSKKTVNCFPRLPCVPQADIQFKQQRLRLHLYHHHPYKHIRMSSSLFLMSLKWRRDHSKHHILALTRGLPAGVPWTCYQIHEATVFSGQEFRRNVFDHIFQLMRIFLHIIQLHKCLHLKRKEWEGVACFNMDGFNQSELKVKISLPAYQRWSGETREFSGERAREDTREGRFPFSRLARLLSKNIKSTPSAGKRA